MADCELSNYSALIQNMPLDQHSATSKLITWKGKFDLDVIRDFCHLQFVEPRPTLSQREGELDYDDDSIIKISRGDLFKLADDIKRRLETTDIHKFVYATIVWGYPSGGRGKNVEYLLKNIGALTDDIEKVAREGKIRSWDSKLDGLRKIKGVGVSTYSKFLYFLRVSVEKEEQKALILDGRLMAALKEFKDFESLEEVTEQKYPDYLSAMHSVANKPELKVDPGKLEMFLFLFGTNLKA